MRDFGRVGRFLLVASTRAYRVALLRYPVRLRQEFGEDMAALFAARAEEALRARGPAGLATVWAHTLRDLMRSAPGPVPGAADGSGQGRTEIRPGEGRTEIRPGEGRTGDVGLLGALREDAGFALGALRRDPRFTALVVSVLGVGIALNVAVFAVLNAYLLRPLPYPASERLVQVDVSGAVSWTEVDHVFERAASWDLDVFTITGDGRPLMAEGAWITPGFLDMYAVQTQLGRTFRDEEAGRDGAPVALISHALWQSHFGGDPDVVGRTFRAFTSDRPDHAEQFEIVGVLQRDFWYLNAYTDVLAPIRSERAVYTGRLRPDVPIERARTLLTELARPRLPNATADYRVPIERLHERHVAAVRPTLVALQAAVLLVLLIACANAAVLLLIRAARRERELGVRRALGASGGRLGRQLVLEGLALAGAAAALGSGSAYLVLDRSRATLEARLGRTVPGGADALAIDGHVLAWTIALAALIGVAFGVVPWVASGRTALAASLAAGRRGGTESRVRRRVRSSMVAAEVALSLALLTAAGLMVQSAANLQRRDLGFDPSGVVRGVVGLRAASYPTAEARVELFATLRDRVAALPAVEAAGLVSASIFSTRFDPRPIEGRLAEGVVRGEGVTWLVDEGYFDALRIDLRRGRGFLPSDAGDAELVAVVSESLARDLFGDADPIGKQVRVLPFVMGGTTPPEPGPWGRVVGVVEDVVRDVGDETAGDLYTTYRQTAPLWMGVVARRRDGAATVLSAIEEVVSELDAEAPFSSPSFVEETVREAMAPTRYLAGLLAGFSAFALLLAVVGLYGVVSYAARQRRQDVAIRMALGADRGSVVGLFVRQGLTVVGAGLAVGSVLGVALGRALEGQLHGVTPGDLPTHFVIAGLLAATAAAAVWIPSRRAAHADPMGVLREE